MKKPCEYCGADLPLGVDLGTRRMRTFHFATCEMRPVRSQGPKLLNALQQALDAAVAHHGEDTVRDALKDWLP